jgi:CoA-dependent NAD(P)H sulfur oxidoreductase
MRLVVIGGVAAGMSAAARARRIDKNLEIVVLEKGATVSHGSCGLPYYIEGQVRSLEELVAHSPDYFRKDRNIDVRTRARVIAIRHASREVVVEAGERIHYDRLVISTGARPAAPSDAEHVFTLNSLEDARRLKEFLLHKKPRRAVVVGAGYIGLEIAGALRANGVSVSVMDAAPEVLGRQDSELTELVRGHLERFGIELRLNTPVRSVDGLDAELIVLAAGLKPNVELAAEAGIELGRTGAIRTTERMETSLNGVYAAGDCVEVTHLLTGRAVYLPLGTTANKTGRVAGSNAAGARERFPGVVGTSIVRICGMGFAFTGLAAAEARREGFDPVATRISAMEKPHYFWGKATSVQLVADRRTGTLIGGTVIGEEGVAGRINTLAAAVSGRVKVEEFEYLDLAYAPPYAQVWDPLLVAAQQLVKLLN